MAAAGPDRRHDHPCTRRRAPPQKRRSGSMFSFLYRTGPRSLSGAIRKALDKDGLPSGIAKASMLRVVQSRGRYSDRKVTYIRVFDPVRAAERRLNVQEFSDLDAYPG